MRMPKKKKVNKKSNNKMKKTTIISLSLFIAIVLLITIFTCFKLYLNAHVEKHLKVEEIASLNKEALIDREETIEYGTTWKYQHFIAKFIDTDKMVRNTKVYIYLEDTEIAKNDEYIFNELKDYNIFINLSYVYEDDKEQQVIESDKEYTIKVVDTTPPMINGLEDRVIEEGSTLDLSAGLSAFDTVDGEVEVNILGNINTKQPGTYKVIVSATDASGNTKTDEYNVIVNAKNTTTTTTTSTRTTTTTSTTLTTKRTTTKKTTTTVYNDVTTKSGRLYMAKQEAKKVVSRIIKPGMSDYEKAEAIYNYLHTNVALQTNQSTEAYQTNYGNEAYAALILKIAACSGFCRAVTLLCDEAGLQSQHVNANLWIHQWNRVLIDGEWIVLDAQGGIFGGTTHPLE